MITCRVMLRAALIMGSRKQSIIGGVPGIYSRHRHRIAMTKNHKDMIWVIVDRLTKSAHFLVVNQKDSCEKLAQLYVNEIVSKHGVPK